MSRRKSTHSTRTVNQPIIAPPLTRRQIWAAQLQDLFVSGMAQTPGMHI